MSWRAFFKREQLDTTALQALARARFPSRRSETATRVMNVLHTKFRIGSRYLLPSARLVQDLGFDDTDFFQMLSAIEKEFTVQIPFEELESKMTLNDFIACVEKTSVQQFAGGNAASPRASV